MKYGISLEVNIRFNGIRFNKQTRKLSVQLKIRINAFKNAFWKLYIYIKHFRKNLSQDKSGNPATIEVEFFGLCDII